MYDDVSTLLGLPQVTSGEGNLRFSSTVSHQKLTLMQQKDSNVQIIRVHCPHVIEFQSSRYPKF